MASLFQTLLSWLVPLMTIGLIVGVQIAFWMPTFPPNSSTSTQPEPASTKKADRVAEPDNPTVGVIGDDASASDGEGVASGSTSSSNVLLPKDEQPQNATTNPSKQTKADSQDEDDDDDDDDDETEEDLFKMNDQWRCACECGFLPPGMLKSFGGTEAMMRLGTGQYYHKQT